jgi:mannose-6-phosphate isomerase-like protein (cupin superfamily)
VAAGAVTTVDEALSAGGSRTFSAAALEQRVEDLDRARWDVGEGSEILFVAAGEGRLRVGDEEYVLAPETGAFLGPGESAEIESRDGRLRLVIARTQPAMPNGDRVVRYAEEESEEAGIGREFRLLACSSATTQFVGVIPPGRAKMHNHPYEEVSYLLEGEGVVHWEDGTSAPIHSGSCIHFPRLVFHSVENLGGAPMRIMGVFHPAGSPADRVAVLDY